MTTKFTSTETKIAAKSMKNNKSCGIEQMYAEHVKYAPECVHTEIADIFNETAATGKYPLELKQGLLTPLPKPKKKKGPRENLRPIILLSVLRKAI